MTATVLAIDDMRSNLMRIEAYLAGENYDLKCFSGAAPAIEYLRSGGPVHAILLDLIMPEMDGFGFMKALRAIDQHMLVPVIMQTAAATPAQIALGIAAGAYYYLTKPYSREVLKALLDRALADQDAYRALRSTTAQLHGAMSRLGSVELSFRTLPDVQDVARFLASLYPDAQTALLGIREIMVNAVEHGNLAITYEDKTALIRSGRWDEEVERRLNLPENAAKEAHVRLDRSETELVLTVEDEGAGFEWSRFLQFDLDRARDSHGRGIAMSRMVSFSEVTYLGRGNKVVCRKQL